MDNSVPDHSFLSCFGIALTPKKALEKLLKLINDQLSDHGVVIQNGSAAVNASVTLTLRSSKAKQAMI